MYIVFYKLIRVLLDNELNPLEHISLKIQYYLYDPTIYLPNVCYKQMDTP